ncbi:Hypothetical predicted protein [Pelobates cultripes]|uniref:Uncharacterized protein n=1 Tax=Pelobates cultripes TaxID=61616 RepID=A0AAD1R8Q1_PELCU|nr:Hypothetical predicted protein [Pelobates cultripes]
MRRPLECKYPPWNARVAPEVTRRFHECNKSVRANVERTVIASIRFFTKVQSNLEAQTVPLSWCSMRSKRSFVPISKAIRHQALNKATQFMIFSVYVQSYWRRAEVWAK